MLAYGVRGVEYIPDLWQSTERGKCEWMQYHKSRGPVEKWCHPRIGNFPIKIIGTSRGKQDTEPKAHAPLAQKSQRFSKVKKIQRSSSCLGALVPARRSAAFRHAGVAKSMFSTALLGRNRRKEGQVVVAGSLSSVLHCALGLM